MFVGKMLGLTVLFLIMACGPTLFSMACGMISGTPAHAQTTMPAMATMPTTDTSTQPSTAPTTSTAAVATPPVNGADIVNPINTVWTLIAAFLVFCMQVGFTMLEAGFCRSRETVNVLVECVFDTCLCGLLFWAFGYAFMFGQGNGLIGWHDPNDVAPAVTTNWFFLKDVTATTLYGTTGVPVLAHWVFQFAFADCASTICSGTMIGRTGFIGDILYSVCVSGFIYPIIGHWAWGPDGFLCDDGRPEYARCRGKHSRPSFRASASTSTTLPARPSFTRSAGGSP